MILHLVSDSLALQSQQPFLPLSIVPEFQHQGKLGGFQKSQALINKQWNRIQ